MSAQRSWPGSGPAPVAAGQRPELHDPRTLASDGTDVTLDQLAAYATLAPSPHNTQPWQSA